MKKYNSFLGAFFSGDNGQGGYNAAYEKKSLANLYGGQLAPEQEQEALAGLNRVNPEAAGKWQEETVKKSAQLLLALGKDNPVAQQAWQTRIKPNLSRIYGAQAASLPDLPDDSVMAVAQQIAGGSQQGALPSDVQSFEYFTKGMTPDQIKQARENKVGLNKNGDWKTTIDPDTKTPVQSNGLGGFRYFDFNTRQWIDISGQGQGGGAPQPKPRDWTSGDKPQSLEEIQDWYRFWQGKGMPKEQLDKGANQLALAIEYTKDFRVDGAPQPAPVQQTAPPVTQAAPPPVTAGGQGGNPLAKPKETKEPAPATWNAPVVETRGGKQVRVRYGTYNGQPIEQVMGEAEITPEPPKPATADERSARGYLDRMAAAEVELDKLVSEGFTPNVKDFYTAGEGAALNWLATPKGQVWRQQQEDWVRAKLRRESGAAIPPEEMDREIKTYFPQPGDSKDVIEAKKKSRSMARQQFVTMAGSAAPSAPNKPAGGAKPNPANLPARNSKGWILLKDKDGNLAYVSPDKKQYEVVE